MVPSEQDRQRLDSFLAGRLERVSRSAVQAWFRKGFVTVNGERAKTSSLVRPGDHILVETPPAAPTDLVPESIPLSILYEDEFLAVVEKPAGMVVHPGAGNLRGTLANALLYHFREISQKESIRPGIVHRLDKDTSGVLVVAKDEHVHDLLSSAFKRRKVRKEYLALVYGNLAKESGVIDVPLGRDPRSRTRISTRSRRPRTAVTEYQVIRQLPGFSYLRVLLHTGRTHQIRVHLQFIGHPVVGDETYGGNRYRQIEDSRKSAAIRHLGRHFLHAWRLTFVHPETGQEMTFESKLPRALADLLSILE